ncbi:phage holin family protein [Raoultella ornithinolytica]|uniref:phage holin family protein n=1 Tax=Raoultella ornithinolytica TaxID=54291 RepID=UPI002738522B|nr:phage holin family protein [Raoultella ornithinolytica]WLP22589.1 phage holin family protein [Raoultella ornithinolytica]HEH6362143.1 phage holin family protein [Raoultella planticola]
MTIHDALLAANAMMCAAIAIRVMTFQRNGARHRRWGNWVAYAVIVVHGWLAIKTVYGAHVSVEWYDIALRAFLLAAVLKTRGNVVQIFKISRSS